MIWLRKIISHLKICYWLLLCIYLIDSANLLSIITKNYVFSLEEGELLGHIDQYRDQVSSPFADCFAEPDRFENEPHKINAFYDIDSPLIPHYSHIKDHLYTFLNLQLAPLFVAVEFIEILYLKNCILLI